MKITDLTTFSTVGLLAGIGLLASAAWLVVAGNSFPSPARVAVGFADLPALEKAQVDQTIELPLTVRNHSSGEIQVIGLTSC